MAEPGVKFNDPQQGRLDEFFKGDGKPNEPLSGFGSEVEVEEPPKEIPKEEPKQETPKEEPKEQPKEEPKDQPKETPREEPKEEPKETPKEQPAEWQFNAEEFNKQFETEYDSPDTLKEDLKDVKELRTKYSQLETDKSELQNKYEEALKANDPMQYFANEEEYKRQLILKKYGQEVNPAALNMIVSADLATLKDMDVLVLGEMVRNPNVIGGESGARELIYDRLGIDPEEDQSSWSTLQKNKIASAATSIRNDLNKLKNVEIPERVDFETQSAAKAQELKQQRQELEGKWDKATSKMLDGFKEFTVQDEVDGNKTDVFTYAIPEAFIPEAKADVLEFMAEQGLEPTQENIEKAMEYVQERFVRENFQNMLLTYGNEIRSKVTEEKDKEVNNPEPPKDTQKPEEQADKEQKEFFEKVKSGESTPQPGTPLFGGRR